MGKKSGPPPPDYAAAAQQTAASNQAATLQQTYANRANQTNPWGSMTWNSQQATDAEGKPVVDNLGKPVLQWSQDTQLDPRLQNALNSQIAVQQARSNQAQDLIGRMQSEFGQPVDWSGVQGLSAGPQSAGNLQAATNPFGFGPKLQSGLDFSGVQGAQGAQQNRQSAEDALYKSQTSRLDPRMAQQQSDLETQLANQGISRNSAAYTRAMDDFNRSKTDAYQQAQLGAATGAGAEAQRNQAMDLALRQQQVGEIGQQGAFGNQAAGQAFGFGLQQQQQGFGQQQAAGAQNFNQQMALANYQNNLGQQQMARLMQQRGFSLNEINALMSGQQVQAPSFGSYNQAGNAGGVDFSGASNSQFGAGTQQQSNSNAATGQALAGVATIAAMFSDRAVKQLIKPIGRDRRGFRIWWFRYFGETLPRVGVVAQEVQRYAPELVSKHPSGLLMVDYSRI